MAQGHHSSADSTFVANSTLAANNTLTADEQAPSRSVAVNPTVSLVVPIYNVERTLEACLKSIAAQDFKDFEVLCMLDGPTDNSAHIAHAFAEQDSRFICIDKKNEGYGASCNQGIAQARGTWIAITEPDDTLESTFLSELLAHAAAVQQRTGELVDLIKCAYWSVVSTSAGDTRKVLCPFAHRVPRKLSLFTIQQAPELLLHHPSIWAAIYRKSYLEQRRIRFVEAPGAAWTDNPFMLETLCQTKRLAYLDRPLYCYTEHSFQEAATFAEQHPDTILDRVEDLLDVTERLEISECQTLQAIATRAMNYIGLCLDAHSSSTYYQRAMQAAKRLTSEHVIAAPVLSPARKDLYCELTQQVNPVSSGKLKARWYAHVAREIWHRVSSQGIAHTINLIRARR